MATYNLGFISDSDLFNHVKETVEKYRFTIDLAEFNKNIIDPIKLTFDEKVYNKDIKDVIEFEVLRQFDKSNTNHIGYFHQNIFKYIGADWSVPQKGFDVVKEINVKKEKRDKEDILQIWNESEKIYVEMKNKHNTMNSSSSQKTYMRMQSVLIKEPTAKCMLVEIIAKKSQNITWGISLDGVSTSHENIRRVSIDKFYELVTEDKSAFKKLCEKLPTVIEDVVASLRQKQSSNTVITELEKLSPNLLKGLYLLAFKKYQGFENFEL